MTKNFGIKKRLKIGFDAKWFFTGNPSGRVLVRNIIAQLILNYPQYDFYVFLKKTDKDKAFPINSKNVHLVYVWGKVNLISNLIVMPLRLFKLKLDVCIFQYFSSIFLNTKHITFINDVIFKTYPQYFSLAERIYFSPMRVLSKFPDRICTISNSEKDRLMKYKFGRGSNIDVIPLGVNPKFKPLERHDVASLEIVKQKLNLPEKFILFVGRINIRKNLINLIKGFSYLKSTGLKLVLTGKFESGKKEVEKLINELGLKDRIILTGYLDDSLMFPLYSLSKLFCYISFDEGFGLPPLEAMVSGVPVIVSDRGSLPEICGDAGTYVDPNDPEDIAEKIDFLLKTPEKYKMKRKLGLERAKLFTWEISAEKLIRSCNKVIED